MLTTRARQREGVFIRGIDASGNPQFFGHSLDTNTRSCIVDVMRSATCPPIPAVIQSAPRLELVRERRGSYVAQRDAVYERLEAAISDVLDLPVEGPGEDDLRAERRLLQPQLDRITARRMAISGQLEQTAINEAGPGREQQGLARARTKFRDDTKQDPSEAKRDGQTGRHLAGDTGALDAMREGKLSARHAALLAKTLHDLGPAHPKHGWLRDRLLAAGAHEDVKTYGRTCRRLLAEVDIEQAQRKVERQHAVRKLNLVVDEQGTTHVHGQGGGFEAEIVHSAIHAFERVHANDTRSPEKRRWDALVAACKASLDAAKAPMNRGVRPHVLVVAKQPADGSDPAYVEGAWTGPIPWTEARRYLVDAGMSGVLLDASDAPMSVSETVRTVPAGLWKALQVRDQVCIGDGCDVPAAWCQVMHLATPYRLNGKLSLQNAAPGCAFHHKMLDHQGWAITWIGSRPVLHPPDNGPEPPPKRISNGAGHRALNGAGRHPPRGSPGGEFDGAAKGQPQSDGHHASAQLVELPSLSIGPSG